MEEGIIYIMTTVMPDIIKIGRTQEKQYKERMRKLETDGYSQMNGLKRYFAIKVSDYINKEGLLQEIFSQQRIGKTELFCLNPELVMNLLTEFKGEIIYPDIQKKDNEKEMIELSKTSTRNRLFNFANKGIPEGSIITFVKDKNITAKVVNEREVEYKGTIWKLSPLALKLYEERGEANNSKAYQGPACFEYNGKKLKDIPDIC